MYTFYYTISGKPVFEIYSATPRLVSEFLWKIMVTFALLLYIIRSYAPICNAAALRCWNRWHFIIIISSSTFYKYTPKKIRGSCHFVEEYVFCPKANEKVFSPNSCICSTGNCSTCFQHHGKPAFLTSIMRGNHLKRGHFFLMMSEPMFM